MSTALATVRTASPAGHQGRDLARGLGWFSLVFGLTELALPGALSRTLGFGNRPALVAAYGVREIAAGAGILLGGDPAPWIQARIAGDALDLATIAVPLFTRPDRREVDLTALLVTAGVTALDILCARRLGALPRLR
ncbi:MAG: hypothetical protein ACRYG6_13405 [Janthinobacterium lividum]